MAQAKTSSGVDSAEYNDLADKLAACATVTELFKLASSDAWHEAVRRLDPDALDALRGVYKQRQTTLDGKVRLAEFDGQTLRLVGVDWWHSDQFDQGPTEGEGVTLIFRPETDLNKRYKAVTSAVTIVRFCNRLPDVPTEDHPLRVQVKQVPVSDPDRAAKGQRMWTIKRLPMGETRAATPF
jgi:hypothetical protein